VPGISHDIVAIRSRRGEIVNDDLFYIGSRQSDHYFRSVCLFVCAEFFSAVFDPIWVKLGHMLHVRV